MESLDKLIEVAMEQTPELDQLAAQLYARRHEGVILKWAEVSIGDWRPQENECHGNVSTWCQNNPSNQAVRGWLYFAFEDLLPLVLFNPHSAVRTEDGNLYDITPSKASQQYPFIVAGGTEAEYADLIQDKNVRRLAHLK
jgi:hypothetical protein